VRKPETWTDLARETFRDWRALSPGILAGALAYFACISLPPLALIVGALFGRFVERHALLFELKETLGGKTARALLSWITLAAASRTPTRTLLSSLALAVIASRVFAHLQTVYRLVWGLPPIPSSLRHGIIKHAVIPALMIVAAGIFTLGFVFILPAVDWLGQTGRLSAQLHHAMNFCLSFSLLILAFAGLHRSMSPERISGKPLWVGAVATAAFVASARSLLIVYFHAKSFHTIYGAAGFVVLIMMWIYFSAHMFVLGAVFTRRYALRCSES